MKGMAVVHAHLHMFLYPHLHGVRMQCMWHACSTITDNNSGINHHRMAHKVACTHKKYFILFLFSWSDGHIRSSSIFVLNKGLCFIFNFQYGGEGYVGICATNPINPKK